MRWSIVINRYAIRFEILRLGLVPCKEMLVHNIAIAGTIQLNTFIDFVWSNNVLVDNSIRNNCTVTSLLPWLSHWHIRIGLNPFFGQIIFSHISSPHFEALILFTNPSARAGHDTRSIFKRSLTGLNLEFSFSQTSCLTKAEEPSLSYYLPIVGGRIIGFIPFPRVLVLCEMQSVSVRIWTRVAMSISYDDNHYSTL